MSLKLASNRDMFDYFELGRLQDPPLVNGVEFANGTAFRPARVYLDRHGYFQCYWNEIGSTWKTVRFDPEMIDSSSGLVGYWDTTLIPFFMGDFEPITGTQQIYSHDSLTIFNERVYEDPIAVVDATPWSMIDWNMPSTASGITSGDDGYWTTITGNNSDNAVFFPGWGAGGHMVLNRGQCRINGNTEDEVMVLVDLSTGAGTILDIPSKFTASPTDFQAGPLFGETTMENRYIQFLPDADSRHVGPKGRIFCSLLGLEPAPGGQFRFYVQTYDWNPTGASGSPDRVHQRLGSSTRCLIDAPASGTTVLGVPPGRVRVGDPNPVVTEHMMFDSGRGRVLMFSSVTDAGGTGGNPRTGCHNIIEFFQSADLAFLRPPQSLAPPSTGRVVIFDTDTRGDLGEAIGGHVVNWSIEATSTEGEILDVSGASPGDPIAVANPNINLTIDYPKKVYEDDIELTEGVDYAWTTTEVDFIGPKPIVGSEVYTVDYAHDPQVPAIDAHGTLLSATSITDAEGLGQTRVRYADDDTLEFNRDKLTAQADA